MESKRTAGDNMRVGRAKCLVFLMHVGQTNDANLTPIMNFLKQEARAGRFITSSGIPFE
jgi:hypothetical protein